MSLVRDNRWGNMGFLSDLRRFNVSLTRAKRHLFMVGNSKMLETNPDLSKLLDIFKTDGMYMSAEEYMELPAQAKMVANA